MNGWRWPLEFIRARLNTQPPKTEKEGEPRGWESNTRPLVCPSMPLTAELRQQLLIRNDGFTYLTC
jgi:hypothetical protein